MLTLDQRYADPAFAVLTTGNFIATIVAGEVTVAHIRQVRQVVASMQKALNSKALIGLHVINASLNRSVSATVREEVTLLAHEARGGATAIVLQGDSFAVTIVRSILSAVSILARTHTNTRLYGDIHESMGWVTPQMVPPLAMGDSGALAREVGQAYKQRIT